MIDTQPGAAKAHYLGQTFRLDRDPEPQAAPRAPRRGYWLGGLVGLGTVFVWSYWTTLAEVAERWANDPQAAQGFLIPVLAVAVLWARRGRFTGRPLRGSWWGVGVVALGLAVRLAGTRYYLEWLEVVSLVPCLAGCCLCLGGLPLLRGAGPSLGLVLLAVPLPYRVEAALSTPLRGVSTQASAFLLQTFGFPAVAEENIILVDEVHLGVVEACSGLGMLLTLFALTAALAFLCRRPRWEKAVVVLSAVPIALLANVARITLTGVLYELWGSGPADVFFHDLAGWVMMPVALGALWLEFKLLSHLFVEAETGPGLGFDFTGAAGQPLPRAVAE